MPKSDDNTPIHALSIPSGPNLLRPRATASTRRGFLRDLGAGVALVGSAGLVACSGESDPATPVVTWKHGVASGDPLADKVVLWTRLTTETSESFQVNWQVATDDAFVNVARRGVATCSSSTDYTVKVDVDQLSPGSRYFYRFLVGGQVSPIGKTKTLPASGATQVKLAVFSCSNYPAGYFNVYAEAAKRTDLDATVHLGDYIYEYAKDGYASASASTLGRVSEPANELLALSDYRKRHAQYKSDPDLQALHAAAPMIAVWDDHEIANDTWKDGAENHQSNEGDFKLRRAAAIQAYHEWMPTRVTQADIIYRSFDFGGLLALHMLDTRLIGREKQLDYANFTTTTGFDAAAFTTAMSNPARQLLGTTQSDWLTAQMASSRATWQVLGNQVLMGRMNIPSPILFGAQNPGAPGTTTVAQYAALVQKAQTAPSSLSPQEQAVLAQPAIPYNLDAWDGYAVARETVLATAKALDKNLVVLAGDSHNAWGNDLLDLSNNRIGVEFGVSSVTSPGFESLFPDDPNVFAASLVQLIGPLEYADTSRRGFSVVTATPTECRCDWIYVSTVTSRTYTSSVGKSLRTLAGAAGRRLVAAT
jgi:alkaline phosphatase D